MAQQGPNPVELYEGAVQYMRPILAGVMPDQLGGPTPCTEWSVQQLITHNIKTQQRVHSYLTVAAPVDNMSVGEPLPPEGALAAWEAGVAQLLEAIKGPDFLDRLVSHPRFGEMPGREVIMLPFTDLLIHKWDLAKATNQDVSLDSSLAEACYNGLIQVIEGRRDPQLFGPGVTVPISASIQDKLLALTGRKP